MTSSFRTGRLELIPATREILAADLNDKTELARLLSAGIPPAWPPPLMDEGVIREFIRMCTDTTGPVFAAWYWVLDEPGATGRTLIGNGGIVGSENDQSAVVLGYSVLDGFQNRGYATEAVGSMIPEIFSWPGIRMIIATTYPDLAASIRVLEKNGFVKADRVPAGTGAEEGTVCYVLEPG
ncbi:MAG: GNAT family N-acetyltransferase [Methanoregula sp.]|jgi:RimJ/RimL family protein N-acetyltransferase|uniref:GNAT family N-acetyltransferase n=1 Tax=Methanoregula sp. TaxID=2052170 RepID=UPI0025F47479|nr:GNAT family N-acetyltransferase [Methanoregula sp.]MCK9631639.1 GNAT family N-acetyltransferase [Methanoregula sp.]